MTVRTHSVPVRNGDVSDKSPEWQSHADKKDGQDCLQLSVCNGFTGPKVSIHPLMISNVSERKSNVGDH